MEPLGTPLTYPHEAEARWETALGLSNVSLDIIKLHGSRIVRSPSQDGDGVFAEGQDASPRQHRAIHEAYLGYSVTRKGKRKSRAVGYG